MADVPRIKIVDSTFAHCNAVGLAGQNDGVHPNLMRWDREPGYADVKVFTDLRLSEANIDNAQYKIGMLVESPAYSQEAIRFIASHLDTFDTVLTFNRFLVEEFDTCKFYPLGGSWISGWNVFEKDRTVSIIVGNKRDTEGQRLRHEVAETFGKITRFGQPYTDYMPDKIPALRPFAYSVVIENCQADYYFTEKLIDAISQGCVPIYCGCLSIGQFFDVGGIIEFDNIAELYHIIPELSRADYESRLDAIERNIEKAKQYRCAEDWIIRNYPDLFQTGKDG